MKRDTNMIADTIINNLKLFQRAIIDITHLTLYVQCNSGDEIVVKDGKIYSIYLEKMYQIDLEGFEKIINENPIENEGTFDNNYKELIEDIIDCFFINQYSLFEKFQTAIMSFGKPKTIDRFMMYVSKEPQMYISLFDRKSMIPELKGMRVSFMYKNNYIVNNCPVIIDIANKFFKVTPDNSTFISELDRDIDILMNKKYLTNYNYDTAYQQLLNNRLNSKMYSSLDAFIQEYKLIHPRYSYQKGECEFELIKDIMAIFD